MTGVQTCALPISRGLFGLLLHSLIRLKVTGNVLDGFFLVNLNSILVTLRVGIGLIGKELIDSFGVDGLGRSLSLSVDGNVRKIQVREGGFDLTEAVVKTISKGATKLFQESVELVILSHCILLSLTKVTLCLQDLCLLILENLLQQLDLRL